ncbi:MAG: ADP-ribosylglycohydrolase family protein [Adhaeribacter sp.]
MKNYLLLIFSLTLLTLSAQAQTKTTAKKETAKPAAGKTITLSKATLKDKIKGGWAGQTIGVTFGGPTEFRFNGTMINDYVPIAWYDGYLEKTMRNNPGLYDDIYMDLTFVDIFEKKGLDAPVKDFADAYANAGYMLWHANQVGRYNIQHGLAAPQSGHWLNNPHADCIDYQIEADFAGLMSPGMPNTASEISDKIGHIMNYGDGWYGGVYVGAMYALSFTSNNIPFIITEALKTIPAQSEFYQCMNDVIKWHQQYPDDWKRTWFEVQRKWTDEVGCPEGVFVPLNIDAKVNAAYVIMGLLYGNGDFTKTMEISTRTGQDSDCNPSSAGGILGAILGYDKIPAYWKMGLAAAEPIDFKYTTMSLLDVYEIGYKHALQNIKRHGGRETQDGVQIMTQVPQPVRFEKSFAGHYPTEKRGIWKSLQDEFTFDFEGIGFVLRGEAKRLNNNLPETAIFRVEVYLNNKLAETVDLPVSFTARRYDLAWKYQLPKQKHTVRLKLLNPQEGYSLNLSDVIIYNDQPAKTALK